jgi:hypothetical protein
VGMADVVAGLNALAGQAAPPRHLSHSSKYRTRANIERRAVGGPVKEPPF